MSESEPYVFVSYSSKDRDWVQSMVGALGAQGLAVWWDREGLVGGEGYEEAIDEALKGASCVIVVWSPDSVQSRWVKDEAATARNREVLVPVLIRGAKVEDLNFRYTGVQTIDLQGWQYDQAAPGFQRLITAIKKTMGAVLPIPPPPPPPLAPWWKRYRVALVGALLIAGAVGATRVVQGFFGDRTPPATVIVEPLEGQLLPAGLLTVKGTVTDESECHLDVNEVPATIRNGLWTCQLMVDESTTELVVEAHDAVHNTKILRWPIVVVAAGDPDPGRGGVPVAVAPELTLLEPAEGATLVAGPLELTGRVVAAVACVVRVNGEQARVIDGSWSMTIELEPGPLAIEVEAEDEAGEVTSLVRNVTVEPPPDAAGPVLTLVEPDGGWLFDEGWISLEGTVSDRSACTVRVNDRPATVNGDRWSCSVELSAGASELVVVARDALGNETPERRTIRVRWPSLLSSFPGKITAALRVESPARLWDAIEATPFFSAMATDVGELRRDLLRVGIDLDRVLASLQGELILAMGKVPTSLEVPPASWPIVLAGDALAADQLLEAQIHALISGLRGELNIDDRPWTGGSRLITFRDRDLAIYLVLNDSRYYLSMNLDLLEDVVRGASERDLDARPALQVLHHAHELDSDVSAFLDLGSLDEFCVLIQLAESHTIKRVWSAPDEVLRGGSLQSAGLGLSLDVDGISARLLLPATGAPDGLLGIFQGGQSFSVREARPFPNTDFSLDLSLDLESGVQTLLALLDAVDPRAGRDELQRELKFQLTDDLLASLGDRLLLFNGHRQAGLDDDAAAWIALRSAAPAERLLDQLSREGFERAGPPAGNLMSWQGGVTYAVLDDQFLMASDRDLGPLAMKAQGQHRRPSTFIFDHVPETVHGLFTWRSGPLREEILRNFRLDGTEDPYMQGWERAIRRGVGALVGYTRWSEEHGLLVEAKLLYE